MPTYNTSTTKVSEEAIKKIVTNGDAKGWRNPRTGATRYYINEEGLADIIGLEQDYYKSGSIRGCSYTGEDGDRVTVAHSRGYRYDDKTYIEDGTVHSTWTPYGADIAELIARNLSK